MFSFFMSQYEKARARSSGFSPPDLARPPYPERRR
jgi:hypothetical protein